MVRSLLPTIAWQPSNSLVDIPKQGLESCWLTAGKGALKKLEI